MEKSLRFTLLLLFFVSLGIDGCSQKESEEETAPPENTGQHSVQVRVRTVVPEPFSTSIQIAGVVRAYDDVMLSPEEGGVIREWKADKGSFVRKGEAVALLRDDVMRPTFLAAESQYNAAELNFQKQSEVYKEAGISEMQFKSSQYTRDAAKAQADLARARLDRMVLKSPIDGILDDRFVDAGEMATPGVPVCRIVNINSVRIRIDVPERYAGMITRGTPVSFNIMAYPGQTFTGKISYVGYTVSPDNRTLAVECIVPNPGRKLKPDMIVKSTIVQSIPRKAILIEESVIQQIDEKTSVVFVAQGDTAEQRVVTLGGREDSKVEVLAGLNAGERLVIDGYRNLSNGQKLAVID